MPSQEAAWPTPFNVVASFPRRTQARQARDLLVQEGIPAEAVHVVDHPGRTANTAEDQAAMRAEMQDEINQSWAAPAFFIPGPPAKAAFWATLFFAAAGGTIGFLTGGQFEPRIRAAEDPGAPMEDPRPAAERDVLVAIHSDRQDVAEHAADLLTGLGAERVDRITAGGTPLPPQASHPRPADPPGWWWKRAGRG